MRFRDLALTTSALCFLSTTAAAGRQDPRNVIAAAGPGLDLRSFVKQTKIPYEQFKLANGMTVIVHTDRTTPQVMVSMWYNVGAKHEVKGRTGFAHLFEHLMFNGTENVPGDFMKPLTEAGATNMNGGTGNDFTNYYELVPTGAVPRALFMESDRMGHLLGAVSQAVLDEQRGVVKNEKRQGANSPLSDVNARITRTLFPSEHPYGHEVIGSMADLDAADLSDVHSFFRNHYGPNNATLILAGDIDVATAKPMVETYFNQIPAGPPNARPPAPVPTLQRRQDETITAPITQPLIQRLWAVPGNDMGDSLVLDGVAGALSMEDGILNETLSRKHRLFESIGASNSTLAQVGTFKISGIVAKGVDPVVAARALDAAIAGFLRTGPDATDLAQWKSSFVLSQAQQMATLSSRASMLGLSAVNLGHPLAYYRDLTAIADLTPAQVAAGARKWLGDRPVYALTVLPGPRVSMEVTAPATALGVSSIAQVSTPEAQVVPERVKRMPLPSIGEPQAVRFPPIEHTRLTNGIKVDYVHWTATPFTTVALTLDAGAVVDPANKAGRQAMMMGGLRWGIAGHDARWIRSYESRLGISGGGGAWLDQASAGGQTPSVNFVPAIVLLAQTLKQPTFPQDELDRTKRERLSQIRGESSSRIALVERTLPRLMNANSPYHTTGDPKAIMSMSRADLIAAHREWVRPEFAHIYLMSDRPLSELQPVLEREFGNWKVAGTAGERPPVIAPAPASPQILLIDMPGSTQTTIYGGQRIDLKSDDDFVALTMANRALGGGFQSRINLYLREEKHWTYGATGGFDRRNLETTYNVSTSVQEDQSGPALAALMQISHDFLTAKPMTAAELSLARGNVLRALSSRFADGFDVLATMRENVERGRPDDYYAHLPDVYRAMTVDQLNAKMREVLDPSRWVWVMVGNASVVAPQISKLGLPIKVIKADTVVPRR